MKFLWKLNALLIILCISLSHCFEQNNEKSITNNSVITNLNSQSEADRHLQKTSVDIYKANDLYLNKINNEISPKQEIKEEKAIKETHTFLEKPVAKKSEPSKVSSEIKNQVTLKKISNPGVEVFDPKKVNEVSCVKKEGYLYILENKINSSEIKIKPIFVVLTLNSFNLYTSTDYKSLFNAIKLEKILRISQKENLKSNHCFSIVVVDSDKNTSLSKGIVTLCADDEIIMNSWISAIQSFKECPLNIEIVDKNSQMIVDFNKVNELRKTISRGPAINSPVAVKNAMSTLFYDNTKKTVTSNQEEVVEERVMKSSINKIVSKIKKGNIQRHQIMRKMASKLQQAKQVAENIEKKKELIKKIGEKMAEKQIQAKEALKKLEEKKQEEELIQAVAKKFVVMKKHEMKDVKQSFQNEIKVQKVKANEKAKEMMQMVIEQKKYSPYDECIDYRILNFNDMPFIDKVCIRLFGENVNIFN